MFCREKQETRPSFAQSLSHLQDEMSAMCFHYVCDSLPVQVTTSVVRLRLQIIDVPLNPFHVVLFSSFYCAVSSNLKYVHAVRTEDTVLVLAR